MPESPFSLHLLRSRIARIEHSGPKAETGCTGTGHPGIDQALGGGLAHGRLHEVFAADPADAGSATGFTAMLARRLGGCAVWLREERAEQQGGRLHAPGLAEIGIDPGRLILGVLPDPLALLRAAADVARCREAGVIVIELWRNPHLLDLTASRRLALAAEGSGVTALLLRIAAQPMPSAAQTRWRAAAAASRALDADAPGHPALEVELLRQRGRPAGGVWQVEWDGEQAILRDREENKPTLSGAMVAVSGRGPGDADRVVPLRRAG